MKKLSLCLACALALAQDLTRAQEQVAGYTSLLRYTFTNVAATHQYLEILKPLSEHVASREPTTWTYRPFLSSDSLSVTVIGRFASYWAFTHIHEGSQQHSDYLARVAAWNASTGAIAAKVKGPLNETRVGVLRSRDDTPGETPSRYSVFVTYYLKNGTAAAEFLAIARSAGEYVASKEPTTWTYR